MNERVYGNDYWVTMVYVDSYQDNVLRGWFTNPYLKKPQEFSSLSDFIMKMESMLDLMGLPQSYSANRSFRSSHTTVAHTAAPNLKRGDKATFCLNVRFRRNSSWQGTLNWLENGSKQNFRSVLELIVLMDSALREMHFPGEKLDATVAMA